MPKFFESPRVFEITKGFIDVRGSQDNYPHRQNDYLGRSSSSDSTTGGSVSVIGHGSNAKVVVDHNAMNLSSSPTPSPSPLRQSSTMSTTNNPAITSKKTPDMNQWTASPSPLQPVSLVVTPPPPVSTTTPNPKELIVPSPTSIAASGESESSPTSEEKKKKRTNRLGLKSLITMIMSLGKGPNPDSKT